MRSASILLILSSALIPLLAQDANDGPSNEKAQKTYKQGIEYLSKHQHAFALDSFKKADKQDGGHCLDCQRKVLKYALELRDWKSAESANRRSDCPVTRLTTMPSSRYPVLLYRYSLPGVKFSPCWCCARVSMS